ncbi:unnamed protein product [[Candida] boidinii]|uniref:Unnamed protein product n=1 Tax=Candida boidinii TaxID=5477 RepID=A0A9W6SY84_CANBO|nr:unnamed protein product [[Candida] boidinii]
MGKDEVKVKRTSRACDRCKKLKIKCDDLKPKCKNCSKHNLQCTYRLTNKKGINKRDLNINRITNIDFANNDPNYLSAFNNVYDASKFRFDDINPNDISNKNIFWYLNPPAANANNSLDPSTTNIATGNNNNIYKNKDRVNNKSPSEGSNTSNNNFGLNTDFKAQTQQHMQDQFMQIQQHQQQQQQQKQQLQLQQQQQQPNYSINIDSIPTAGETPLLAPNFTNFSIDQSPDFQSPQNFGYGVESPNFDKLIKLNFLQNNATISDLAAFQGNPLQRGFEPKAESKEFSNVTSRHE